MKATAILVPCCQKKLDRPAPAKALYQGYTFKLARAFAERSGFDWIILSAMHHILEPDQWVHPYDRSFPTKDAEAREWGRHTFKQLMKRFPVKTDFISLCPPPYTRYFQSDLRKVGHFVLCPLDGLGSGLAQLYLKTGPFEQPSVVGQETPPPP